MNEKTKLMLEMARENERLKLALENLRTKMVNLTLRSTGNCILLDGDELNEVLKIAGLPTVNKKDPSEATH